MEALLAEEEEAAAAAKEAAAGQKQGGGKKASPTAYRVSSSRVPAYDMNYLTISLLH